MIEKIKLQIEIIKIKLLFFVGVVGAGSYLLDKIETYEKYFNHFVLLGGSYGLLLYGSMGIIFNMILLNKKYTELDNE